MFPQLFGKYVLEREIAAGGMARVYLGTLRGAVGFEKRVVVKQIRPELASDEAFVRRFVEEAKTAVELSHPNIVPVYELGVEQGVYYLSMEYCAGATLADVLGETGPLDAAAGAYVGAEICRALDYAHRRGGIVHRDVTPRNVMLDDEGAVRLIDFGIAAPASVAGEPLARVDVFGSPGHMPPEQLHGRALTPATDVFAVAALLVEAWTGTPAFRRATAAESEAALVAPIVPLDDQHPELSALAPLIASALSLEPGARPQSAEALARPLREFLQGSDSGDLARQLGERVREVRRRLRSSRPLLDVPATRDAGATAPRPSFVTPTGSSATFAAHAEIVEWTRKLERTPPAALERALDASLATPAAPGGTPVADVTPARRPSARRAEDAAAPTTASRLRGEASAGGWRLAAAALAGMVVAGLISVRFLGARSAGGSASSEVREHAPPQRSAPSATLAPRSSPEPPAATIRASVETPRLAPTAFAGAQTGQGTLALSAAPSATVSVGARSGSTPWTLSLPAGTHAVTFRSALLGEQKTVSVQLEAGQTRSVHADFTGATPRVYVR